MESKSLTFELKGAISATGEFEGYGSTFGNIDQGDDIVAKGAFTKSISEHASASTMPSMFFSHIITEPVGDWLEMREDAKGLWMHGKLWVGQGIPKVEQAYLLLKGRSAKGLSIGYITRDASIDKKGIRTLLDLDLKEVSPTPFPMNTRATVSAVKALPAGFTKRDLEQSLRDVGLSITQAKAVIARGWSGIDPRDADSDEASADALVERIRNQTRILKG